MPDRAKGVAAIVFSAFGFALMALFVRLCDDCGPAISSVQKSFFRNLVALAIALAVFCRRPSRRRLVPDRRAWTALFLRSLLGTAGIFAHFYALCHVNIAEAQTLNKLAPFFTVLFAWIFLGEAASRRHLLPLGLAFGGVLLIAKPGFAGADGPAMAMGVLGGLAAGGAYACVRALRRRAVEPTFIVLFFSAFSCLAAAPFMLASFDPMTWRQVAVLLGAGAGAAMGQYGVSIAYGYAAPREIAVYDYSNLLFTLVFGFVCFGQVPDLAAFAGIGAILLAAFRLFRPPAD